MKQQNKEKLSDKAFARLAATSILAILICLVCLCSTTYAWFTNSVSSGNNKIKTASECLLTVTVNKDGAEEAEASFGVGTENAVTRTCEGEYSVTLFLPQGSASGYLVLSVGAQEYYSDYLQRNDEADQTLTFTLNVKTAQDVIFTAYWGIYSADVFVIDEALTIG